MVIPFSPPLARRGGRVGQKVVLYAISLKDAMIAPMMKMIQNMCGPPFDHSGISVTAKMR